MKTEIERIDTHQHILLPQIFRYPWTVDFKSLQSEFSLEQYKEAAQGCGILGTVFMEVDVAVDQSGNEARYFSQLAEDPRSGISGVVASGRPESEGFQDYLDSIEHPSLKGIRRVLHCVPDSVSEGTLFQKNVAALSKRSLTFDICVRANQLPLAAALADACPETQFILDHCGCPDVSGNIFKAWFDGLSDVAQRDNVAVKISGLPAYAPAGAANSAILRPWVETTIQVFGWDRCLWGGDWPVCALNGSLLSWCNALDDILLGEPSGNLRKLFILNAKRIYRL